MKKIAADKNYRMLKSAQDYKAECAKKIEKAKSDGYWPLKKAIFRDAKGNALVIFQRSSDDPLRASWHEMNGGSKADQKELVEHALNCIKNNCARFTKIKVKSDPNIAMITARATTEEELKEAWSECW